MILNSPYISGSLTVTGNIITSGSITLSGSVASASYAASATSASYALNATTASYALNATTASYAVNATTASYADALTVAGTLTAQTLVVQTITSSVDFVTGSTRFGSLLTNTHVFSGSVTMNPGGLFVSSSGVVGIGFTTPSSLLYVSASGGLLQDIVTIRGGGGSGAFGTRIESNNGDDLLYVNHFTYDITMATITGNVGIGTATPAFKLDVQGTGRFTGALTGSSANFSGEIKSGDTITLGAAAVGGFWTWGVNTAYLVAGTGKALNFNPNGVSGTTGLSIATTGAATFSSTIRSDAATGLALGSIAGYRRLQYDLASTTFGFLTDTNSVANIDAGSATFNNNVTIIGPSNSANVGTTGQLKISSSTGVTSPASDIYLQAVVDSATPGDRGTAFVVQTGRTSGIAERFRISSTGAATFSSSVTINSGNLLYLSNGNNGSSMQIWNSQTGAANNFLIYDNAASAYRFVIGSTGNVFVGASGGDGRFYVKTATANAYNASGYNGANANIRLESGPTVTTGTTTGISMGVGGSAEAYIGAVQNSSNLAEIVFQNYDGAYRERMRITSGGVVQITNAADAQLSLSAAGSTAYVRFANSAGDVWGIGNSFSAANTDFQLYNFTTTAYGFRVPRGGIYANTTAAAANVQIDSNGYFARSTSSSKYKNSIINYDKGLDIVNQLRPVYYKGNNNGDTVFAGLIAEEVHELGLTEFVQYAEDGTPDALAYQNMTALAFKAIQELKAQNDDLQSQINELKNQ